MAYQITCPSCHQEGLDPRYNPTTCSACGKSYSVTSKCPKCNTELERVKACGAVDFFCNHCNELVSKRQAQYELTEAQ